MEGPVLWSPVYHWSSTVANILLICEQIIPTQFNMLEVQTLDSEIWIEIWGDLEQVT